MYIFQVSDEHVDAFAMNNASNIEVIGSQEPLGHTICKIAREVIPLSFCASPFKQLQKYSLIYFL